MTNDLFELLCIKPSYFFICIHYQKDWKFKNLSKFSANAINSSMRHLSTQERICRCRKYKMRLNDLPKLPSFQKCLLLSSIIIVDLYELLLGLAVPWLLIWYLISAKLGEEEYIESRFIHWSIQRTSWSQRKFWFYCPEE